MTIALLVAVAAVVIGYMTASETVATDRFYLKNTAGNVLFDHGGHNETIESCATCHHSLYGAAQVTSCEDCHGDDVEAAEFEHASLKEIHGQDCSACHEQKDDDDQARSCRECHPYTQESEEPLVSCTECHDDGYEPDMMPHDDYQETGDHSCLGCHNPNSISEVYHTNCTGCHLEAAPDNFANSDGSVMCSACHLR